MKKTTREVVREKAKAKSLMADSIEYQVQRFIRASIGPMELRDIVAVIVSGYAETVEKLRSE